MNIPEIIKVVVNEYNGNIDTLNSKTKMYPYPKIRQCISFILHAHYQLSYRDIGMIVGYSDKTNSWMSRRSASMYKDSLDLYEHELNHYNNILIELGLAKKTIALDDVSQKFKNILENTVTEINLLIKSL